MLDLLYQSAVLIILILLGVEYMILIQQKQMLDKQKEDITLLSRGHKLLVTKVYGNDLLSVSANEETEKDNS